jgi:rhodanese-related sulfurtransferase
MDVSEKRTPKRQDTQMVPQPVKGEPGLVLVDTTWGIIQPIQIAEGVRTVDEIELNGYFEQRLPIIDARTASFYEVSTIPGARNIPHNEAVERMDELDRDQPAILFCNGPQCPQSPNAIRNLLAAGYPAKQLLYYRGGIHDWVTLGLPVVRYLRQSRRLEL